MSTKMKFHLNSYGIQTKTICGIRYGVVVTTGDKKKVTCKNCLKRIVRK